MDAGLSPFHSSDSCIHLPSAPQSPPGLTTPKSRCHKGTGRTSNRTIDTQGFETWSRPWASSFACLPLFDINKRHLPFEVLKGPLISKQIVPSPCHNRPSCRFTLNFPPKSTPSTSSSLEVRSKSLSLFNHMSHSFIGGTAACVVATRLSDADPNLSILVIEAGSNNYKNPTIETPFLFFSHLAPGSTTMSFHVGPKSPFLQDRSAVVPTARVLGGGSSVNMLMYSRGQRSDFDSWETPGWSAHELLPYMKKVSI